MAVGLFVRRVTPFKSNLWFGLHSLCFLSGALCITASFVLGFVYVGTATHLSLKTPTRGTHSIVGLIIMTFTFLLGLIRYHTISRDVDPEQRHEPMYRAYDQVVIAILLLGIVCLYCGFADFSAVDASVNVTSWYWIYGICVGAWVVLFFVFEMINLYRHRVKDQLEYQRLEAEKAVIAESGMTPRTYRRAELARQRAAEVVEV